MATQTAPSSTEALLPHHIALRSIDITVADLDSVIDYYRRVLSLSVLRRLSISVSAFGPELVTARQGSVEVAVTRVPTGIINFMQFPRDGGTSAPPAVTGPGYTHMCIQSAATDPALPKLIESGLDMVSRCDGYGVDLGGYGVRYAYGRDFEGRMVEVEHLDRPSRSDLGWVTHIASVVHDHPQMLEFYTRLLGTAPYRTTEQSGRKTLDDVAGIDNVGILGGWFRVRNLDIEVWSFTSPRTPVAQGRRRLDDIGYNAFSLEVGDFAAEVRRLEALGVELVGPEIDFGGWRLRYAADPEGNLFSIQQQNGAPANESGTSFDPLRF